MRRCLDLVRPFPGRIATEIWLHSLMEMERLAKRPYFGRRNRYRGARFQTREGTKQNLLGFQQHPRHPLTHFKSPTWGGNDGILRVELTVVSMRPEALILGPGY